MADSLPHFALLVFGSLFAVLNPFATVPPFVAMTADNTVFERCAMAKRASIIACAVLLAFAMAGPQMLGFFGVSEPAFRIAGGLVLIRVAFGLIQGGGATPRVTLEERLEGVLKDDVSVTPLAIPLLCGPATITAVVLLSSEATNWIQMGILIAIILMLYVGLYALLRLTSQHSNRMGETAIKVSSRLIGLVLVAISVQFVLEGVRSADLF